jgi:acetylornithine deacetylase
MSAEPRINIERLRDLLVDMVDIYSPSGKEGEIITYLKGYLKRSGMAAVLQEVEKERRNIIIHPHSDECDVLFIGHLDTVPAPDLDRFSSREDDDEIWGLGTADMKGGCAAMIEAFLAYREAFDGDLPAALALVVGEEENGDGALTLMEDYRFQWAVVGEPTDLNPCFGHFGYLEFILNTRGRRLHASQASGSDNAVMTMLDILRRLSLHCDSAREDVIFNIRDLNSSHAGFAVPDWCEAWIDLHFPSRYPVEELIYEIEDIVHSAFPGKTDEEISISCTTVHPGYTLPEKGLLPETLKELYTGNGTDWSPGVFVSDSDAVHLWQNGIRPVILGPGKLEKAHTYDESVSFTQVTEAARLYLDLLVSLREKMQGRVV